MLVKYKQNEESRVLLVNNFFTVHSQKIKKVNYMLLLLSSVFEKVKSNNPEINYFNCYDRHHAIKLDQKLQPINFVLKKKATCDSASKSN